jgi:hypothetical protein
MTKSNEQALVVDIIAAKTTTHKILRGGYYWPTIFTYVHKFVRECQPCQFFTSRQKLAAFPLQPVVVEAPFQEWGLDFIGNSRTTQAMVTSGF